MQDRSLGVTALAFSSVMIGLYCQFAAIILILTGSVFTAAGSMHAAVALVNGAIFMGLTVAAYFVGYGLWTRKHWSWAGSVSLLVVFIGANVMLSALSTNVISSVLPAAGAVLGIWYLHRPAIKTELLGSTTPAPAMVRVGDGMEMPELAH